MRKFIFERPYSCLNRLVDGDNWFSSKNGKKAILNDGSQRCDTIYFFKHPSALVSQVLSKRIVGYRYIAACPNLVRKLFYPV